MNTKMTEKIRLINQLKGVNRTMYQSKMIGYDEYNTNLDILIDTIGERLFLTDRQLNLVNIASNDRLCITKLRLCISMLKINFS